MVAVALTVAGSDPSGGAGIQADLKTFHQLGVYGTSAITLLTVQNTTKVSRVEVMDARLVVQQIDAVLEDLPVLAAKTGALGSAANVRAVAERFARPGALRLVVDPVMISKHGAKLIDEDARHAVRDELLKVATLVTPNTHEAAELVGQPVENVQDAREAGHLLVAMGARAALVKGGHLSGDPVDVLVLSGETLELPAPRIDTPHTHGTGCTYSAAITALLAQGLPLLDAVIQAKGWLTSAIESAPGLGHGHGPVNHHAAFPSALGAGGLLSPRERGG
jgi:hydroxymethylpyrimidine/phosphomethylpyrimidine kinase